ncbi:MAG: hypothetical protein M3Z20_05500 [Chloroflexota bacterium]|nr:hypothetical protein [Chloroflexota bacterium]
MATTPEALARENFDAVMRAGGLVIQNAHQFVPQRLNDEPPPVCSTRTAAECISVTLAMGEIFDLAHKRNVGGDTV